MDMVGQLELTIVSDSLTGGAALATNNLQKGLIREGILTSRFHFSPESKEHPRYYSSLDKGRKRPPFERIIKNFNKSFSNYLRAKRHRLAFKNALIYHNPTFLNIHNIHNSGISHCDIPENLPIIWTMHDCWVFDQYAFKWKDQHGSTCYSVKDRNSLASKRKLDFLKRIKKNLILVAPSKWIADLAKEKTQGNVRVECIPYGVDTDLFLPIDKNLARNNIGLVPKKIWLGSASTWSNSRKGFDLLAKALHEIDCSDIGLLCWGEPPKEKLPDELTVKLLGKISDTESLSINYSASDVFICPSRADNLPNTVLESLSCGTPLIGSDVGGIPEMIQEGLTGLIFKSNDPMSCYEKILQFKKNKRKFTYEAKSIREYAKLNFSLKKQSDLYRKIIFNNFID